MTIRSESTLVPPVTALRSPPLSRMTGALSPVMADSSTLAIPSITSPSPGMRSPASQTTMSPLRSWVPGTRSSVAIDELAGHGLGPGLAQRIGLCLAATLGHRLREVSEEHREPEPEGDLEVEEQIVPPGEQVPYEQEGQHNAAHFDHEHDGVLGDQPGIKLAERRPRSRA